MHKNAWIMCLVRVGGSSRPSVEWTIKMGSTAATGLHLRQRLEVGEEGRKVGGAMVGMTEDGEDGVGHPWHCRRMQLLGSCQLCWVY